VEGDVESHDYRTDAATGIFDGIYLLGAHHGVPAVSRSFDEASMTPDSSRIYWKNRLPGSHARRAHGIGFAFATFSGSIQKRNRSDG
jgi:hypothetical protein